MDIQEYRKHFAIVPIIKGINYNAVFTTFPELNTSTIRLRETAPSDIPILHQFFKEASTFKNYVEPIGEDHSDINNVKIAYLDTAIDSFNNIGRITWAIVEKESNHLTGLIICYTDNLVEQPVEIEGFISEKFRRKGLALETLNLVTDFFFKNGIKKLLIKERTSNEPAIKLLEKSGFACEHIDPFQRIGFFIKNNLIKLDKYHGWKGQVFKGKAFSGGFYKILEVQKTGGSYSNAQFPIDDNVFIAYGCDPQSPRDFMDTNKNSVFCIDESKQIEDINGAKVIYAKKISNVTEIER